MIAAKRQSVGILRSVAVAQRRCRMVGCKAVSREPVRQEPTLSSMTLPMVTVLLASPPALAEDAATGAAAAADAADAVDVMGQNSGILGYTNGGLVIAFSPLVIYGAFYLYRATINPKAKLADLLFVGAACVVLGNILSILLFKVRLY